MKSNSKVDLIIVIMSFRRFFSCKFEKKKRIMREFQMLLMRPKLFESENNYLKNK